MPVGVAVAEVFSAVPLDSDVSIADGLIETDAAAVTFPRHSMFCIIPVMLRPVLTRSS